MKRQQEIIKWLYNDLDNSNRILLGMSMDSWHNDEHEWLTKWSEGRKTLEVKNEQSNPQ